PDVLRGHELLLLVDPPGDEFYAFLLQHFAVDDVAAHVPHERLAAILGRPGIAAVDGGAGRSREIAGGASVPFDRAGIVPSDAQSGAHEPPRLDRADAVNFRRRAVGGNADASAGRGQIRVAGHVAVFE